RLRDRGTEIRGPQWRTAAHLRRGRLVPDLLRDPDGGRLFLEQAHRGRPGASLRLAQGQIRALLASGSGIVLADDGSRREKIGAGDEGLPTDEKFRHRDVETCL